MQFYNLINLLFTTPSIRKFNLHTTRLYSKKNIAANNIKKYIPKTYNQQEYQSALNDPNIDLLFCLGPAGTGKTLFACKYAIESFKNIEKS